MREIHRLIDKFPEDGISTEMSVEEEQRLYYILRAQGGQRGAELARALESDVEEAPPEPE